MLFLLRRVVECCRPLDEALARNISINGLVIVADAPAPPSRSTYEPPIVDFYRDNVIGGAGAFVMSIDDFDSFAYAIVGKIVREVAGVPPETRLAGVDRHKVRIVSPCRFFAPTAQPTPALTAATSERTVHVAGSDGLSSGAWPRATRSTGLASFCRGTGSGQAYGSPPVEPRDSVMSDLI